MALQHHPAAGEPGAETWGPTDKLTGGGAVWTPFSLDPAQGLVFVPAGNPAPDFFGDVRPGSNLFTNSLVVLEARTGKLVWHYQAVPHDLHDWDLTQVSPLFTAVVKGQERRLVTVVGKDGLLHVLDRETREHLYEVAVSRRQNVELPVTTEGVYACPGPLGGVQWNGPAYSPRTNLLYVASVDWCGTFKKSVRDINALLGSSCPSIAVRNSSTDRSAHRIQTVWGSMPRTAVASVRVR